MFSAQAIAIANGARCKDSTTFLGTFDDVKKCVEKVKDRYPWRDMFEMKRDKCYVYKNKNYPCKELQKIAYYILYRIVWWITFVDCTLTSKEWNSLKILIPEIATLHNEMVWRNLLSLHTWREHYYILVPAVRIARGDVNQWLGESNHVIGHFVADRKRRHYCD